MTNLAALRATHETALRDFESLLESHFPGADKATWFRACSAIRGENTRRNDDTSRVALATDTELSTAWDAYIVKLHAFYAARDGSHGFLGSRQARQ